MPTHTGATINIKGSTTGTVSDAEGAFTITVPNEKSVLIITSVGFDPVEISAEGRDVISVGLKEKPGSLEEVVVTGYTSQKKRSHRCCICCRCISDESTTCSKPG